MSAQFNLRCFALEELKRLSQSFPCKKGSPSLVWNSRLRTSAGRYRRGQHLIELNPHLLTDEGRVKETVGHEYAHAVAVDEVHKESSHGPTWRKVMDLLGLPPTVCHSYDIDSLRRAIRQLKIYECPVCKVQWEVRKRYADNCYHRCASNTKRARVKLVGVVTIED